MTAKSNSDRAYQTEIVGLRDLLTQAGLDAARLLAQAGIDASKTENAKQLQRLLVEELHHRAKNTLAIVMAITSQSLRSATTLEEGRIAVENRLFALGRVHDQLLQSNWASAKLYDVIFGAIEPFEDSSTSRFSIQDSGLEVGAAAVLPLTMSLNELCTNAAKYGALSVPTGRIVIAVSEDEQAYRFKLSWTELGGPTVQEPKRRSFGTRLINRLADQLHATVQQRYEPQGLVYELDAPLSLPGKIAS
jgi:two-component sensor histidine kinase